MDDRPIPMQPSTLLGKTQTPVSKPPSGLEQINVRIFVILLMIYIYFLYKSYYRDMETIVELNREIQIIDRDHNGPFKKSDNARIEEVVAKYIKNNEKNRSALAEILRETRNGIVRGFIGGSLMGGGLSNVLSGAILFGSLGGITKGYVLNYTSGSRLV
jgi:hypothetical protein